MNKVIQKLMQKATTTYLSGLGERDELDPEKFAELLVKECAELVKSASLTKDGHTWRTADSVVLEHFGVEK